MVEEVIINTDDVLKDFVLNTRHSMPEKFKLRKPAFENAPEPNLDDLLEYHRQSMFYDWKQIHNPNLDLSTIQFNRVVIPGLAPIDKLQFPAHIKAKKKLFLTNWKQFDDPGSINLLYEITRAVSVPQQVKEESAEKKLASEFLRKNLKTADSDFGTLLKGCGGHMSKGTYRWAHLVPSDKVYTIHPREMALKLDFKLDLFQAQAIHYITAHKNVFVAAHTSSGKTVIAEYAVALSDLHNTNTIYTSPIKALSNQKFRDFSKKFTKEKIGLITGDVQINVNYNEGSGNSLVSSRKSNAECSQPNICTIMTTEILLTMLYKNEKFLKNVEFIVFDECHYINDDSRGYVWEEIFILLPSHITIIMLSATIPNLMEFNEWIGELKNREVYIVKTERRPIPLEYYMVAPQYMNLAKYKKSKQFGEDESAESVKSKGNAATISLQIQTRDEPFSAFIHCTTNPMQFEDQKLMTFNSKVENKLRTHRLRDYHIYPHVVRFLSGTQRLPTVIFVLSRKRCDELANALYNQNVDLLGSDTERHFVAGFLTSQLSKLTKSIGGGATVEDLPPQIHEMRTYLMRGYACHHSGLLQSLKEIVELLFQMGYVKLLFATETFAIGVNMPTRTVVFDSLQKFDGRCRRTLTAVEFTQMAGRAGRRGQDDFGTVLMLVKDKYLPPSELRQLCLTNIETVNEITTKFQLNYKLLLNVMRTNELPDPQQENYIAQCQELLADQISWTPLPGSGLKDRSLAGRQATLSIEKFLKFNFYEYQKTARTLKLDNFRIEVWKLVGTILQGEFFGYFEPNRMFSTSVSFFEESIKDGLRALQANGEDRSFVLERDLISFLIYAIETCKCRAEFWTDFLFKNSDHFFKNGRLIRISHALYDQHYAICIGGVTRSKTLNVLLYKNTMHSARPYEDWIERLQAEDGASILKLAKFLNRFGCHLWQYRNGKATEQTDNDVADGEYDDEDSRQQWESRDQWKTEDENLIEILNSFLKIDPKLFHSKTEDSTIDWQDVVQFVYKLTRRQEDNTRNFWSKHDSTMELVEVALKDVEGVYNFSVMAKHDLTKEGSIMKVKTAFEEEVERKGGMEKVVRDLEMPWLDELRVTELPEGLVELWKEKLKQKEWLEGKLVGVLKANMGVISDAFSRESKAIRYFQLARAQYEPHWLAAKYRLENLQFYRSYTRKLAVLDRLSYVRRGTQELTLKGRMASELSNQKLSNELLLTEIIFNYAVVDLEEADICALLSCTLCRAKIDDNDYLELFQCLKESHPQLLAKFYDLEKIFHKVQSVEKEMGVDQDENPDGEKSDLNCSLILVVYYWAQGKSFTHCKSLTQIQDGIVVRCIQNLIELLRDVRNAAHAVGEPILFNKINSAINLIKRDIIFAPSLYTL